MKQGKSSSNPDAASYIPLHKREANGRNKVFELTTKDSLTGGDETTHGYCGTEKYFPAGASGSDIYGIEGQLIACEILLEQSLAEVYAVNGGDLGTSIDMLIQLGHDVHEDLLYMETGMHNHS
ncbi:hypothetical protein LWI28_003364 [Acer negundo]|uniref:Uncharacterized protein n=1 Tax=Acer negundo TaxID=4023 RepID=A0AAD5J815_ACENE|nr:hypothetical protein LWI28_003364 [Acer negundo]